MPDTEDEDSASEKFWPEGYKRVIREDVRRVVADQLAGKKRFRHVYRQDYAETYPSYEDFLAKITDMVVVGAENGADDAFDEIVDAFLEEGALPEVPAYVDYFWPQPLPRPVKASLRRVIVDEYSQDDIYRFAYDAGYKNDFNAFDDYMEYMANLVVNGTMNGADDTLERVYRSFMDHGRLIPVRRYPRRLKMW